MSHLSATLNEHLVAIADVDESRHAAVFKWFQDKQCDAAHVQVFTDYRRVFDKLKKDFDAVFIATPNHQHAVPALLAMQLGKHVYCEKPVCHSVGEARAMRARAARSTNRSPTHPGASRSSR